MNIRAFASGLCTAAVAVAAVLPFNQIKTSAADDKPLTPAGSLTAFRAPHGAWKYSAQVAPPANNPMLLSGKPEAGEILFNELGRTSNLITNDKFGDVAVSAEFMVPKGSNSGIKLQRVYEIQIADSFGKANPTASDCGGIYPRAELFPSYHHIDKGFPPASNACKAPGEWQSLEIVFRSPTFDSDGKKTRNALFESVTLNGVVIHKNVEVPYPTGHAWRKPETATGPIMLQGDHGPVAFRNVRVRTLEPNTQDAAVHVPDDINHQFESESLDVASFVKRFESEDREVFKERDAIIRALGLTPGMSVADIGAGTGLFTRLFAEKVGPRGTVHAVDISQPFLKHIAEDAKKRGLDNIRTTLATQSSTGLPEVSCDLVFMCDTYHHLEDPTPVLRSIQDALKPGGRFVIVEFDRHDSATEFVKKHVRAGKDVFIKEIEAAGFERVALADAPKLKENFIVAFRKRDSAAVRP